MTGDNAVVLATLGSIGDLLPFLAVARALRARGHAVIVATNRGYESIVQMVGAEFCGIPDDFVAQDPFRDIATGPASQTWDRVWHEFFVPAAQPTYRILADLVQSRPCAVYASWSMIGARLACESSAVPFCEVYLSPHAVSCDAAGEGSQAAQLHALRDAFGVSATGLSLDASVPAIGFFPDWFAQAVPTDLKQVVATGFPFHDDALLPVSRSELRRFLDEGEAPIVFTPGSFMEHADAFFDAALEACNALARRAIFLTPHRRQIPASLPDTILHADYVPLHRVLGRAAALFHHGGIGTCAQAMRAGTPQIIAPVFFDQTDNAARVAALGLGVSVERSALDATHMAEAIEAALVLPAGGGNTASGQRASDPDPGDMIAEQVEGLLACVG